MMLHSLTHFVIYFGMMIKFVGFQAFLVVEASFPVSNVVFVV